MSDPENPSQPLIRAPSVAGAPEGGRPSRAYKVAGLTLLACILIVGQVMTAYFLLSQKSDIKSLEEQNNNMKAELTKGRSVSVPVRMHMPMNALTKLTYDPEDEESSTGKMVPLQGTECQQEAAGVKPVQVPGFRPACDEHGFYKSQQCFMGQCWCVNPVSGEQLPGSTARCNGARPAAHMNIMLSPDDIVE